MVEAIEPERYGLAGTLLRTALTEPGKVALVDFSSRVTYGELLARAAGVAAALGEIGVSPGSHVGIVLEGPQFVEAYLAVLAAGGVAVPLNPRSPAFELGNNLRQTRTSLVLCGTHLGPHGVLEASTARETALKDVELVDYSEFRAEAIERGSGEGRRARGVESDPGSLLAGFCEPRPDDPAVLIMTGGTSGSSRPAVLTHRSMVANLRQLDSHPGTRAVDGDIALGVLPLFHVFGLNVIVGFSLYSGCTVAFPSEAAPSARGANGTSASSEGAQRWAEGIRELGVTVVVGSPNMYRAFLEEGVPPETFRGVRVCTSGAAPLSRTLFEEFAAEYDQPLWEGYGMTEASPVITSSRLLDSPIPGSVGLPLCGIELELRDPEGNPLEEDDPGEIFVRGENVFAGYFGDEEATRQALVGGWLRTGDIGVLDEQGRLYLVDRCKDIVIVGGFNVYPAEIESLLVEHEAVAEAAVVGERGRDDERLIAYVVPSGSKDPEAADLPEALKEYLSRRVARYKVPREIRVVAELPRTALNKVSRRALLGSAGH